MGWPLGQLLLSGVSDNVGGVKHVATTLPYALEQERHFALIGEVLNPTKARFLISIQVGKLSSTHASLRSQHEAKGRRRYIWLFEVL